MPHEEADDIHEERQLTVRTAELGRTSTGQLVRREGSPSLMAAWPQSPTLLRPFLAEFLQALQPLADYGLDPASGERTQALRQEAFELNV